MVGEEVAVIEEAVGAAGTGQAMGAILPVGVAFAESFGELGPLQPFPGEAHLIERAVAKRRQDFMGARQCARQALAQLGEPEVAIGRGERGMPVFPPAVVGSLTHCEGYRAAVLAHRLRFRTIGIDAEPHEPLPEGVLDSVSLPAEREWLAANETGLHLDRLLFCAKEATYKAWFPVTLRWLGFEDAQVTVGVDGTGSAGSFHSTLLVPGDVVDSGAPLTGFDGRWRIVSGLILTAVVVSG